ncbi:diacylglyceryl transferase [Tumebacillus algifaecis]|uniref:Diacylglyceryl transferase n=1 Tax=Tumebacillus algifaecis TaxID=1214604 RepID=A0A223D1L0_9BACL|nr:prolipoprotein diacylglyceryl transferase family protein [Tumebacillus algifaecis]ASS75264.1 diacylglyceryl transferase [Tumebacillus algifaecis]
MTFPVYLHLGSLTIHPHFLFETLAYMIGFRVYLYTRSKERTPVDKALYVIAGAIVGAALGSKILYWLEDPAQTMQRWNDLVYLMEGKTIVGGLLGGLIGVEIAKKMIGWTRSTGDDFALPLILGMMIGRIGCFLTGLSDHTYGTETTWFTGVDFGDGVLRHPTQLYEIAFLAVLGAALIAVRKRPQLHNGALFQFFMIGYLGFRLVIDFIKPTPHPYLILNNIQLACIAGLIYYILLIRRQKKENTHAEKSSLPVL